MFIFFRGHVRLNAKTGECFTSPWYLFHMSIWDGTHRKRIEKTWRMLWQTFSVQQIQSSPLKCWTDLLPNPVRGTEKPFMLFLFALPVMMNVAQLPLGPPLLTVTSCISHSCTQIEFPILFLPQRTLSGHVKFCPAENESDGRVWGLIDCSTTQQITMQQLKVKQQRWKKKSN